MGFFRDLRGVLVTAVPEGQGQGCSELCLQQPYKPNPLFTFIFLTAQLCLITF